MLRAVANHLLNIKSDELLWDCILDLIQLKPTAIPLNVINLTNRQVFFAFSILLSPLFPGLFTELWSFNKNDREEDVRNKYFDGLSVSFSNKFTLRYFFFVWKYVAEASLWELSAKKNWQTTLTWGLAVSICFPTNLQETLLIWIMKRMFQVGVVKLLWENFYLEKKEEGKYKNLCSHMCVCVCLCLCSERKYEWVAFTSQRVLPQNS